MEKKIYINVLNAITEEDPLNLILDENYDEYEFEAKSIASKLKIDSTVESIQDLVYQVFVQSFDQHTAGDKNKYLNIAKKIAITLK